MNSLLRGSGAQRARLVSGLILLAFAATHFLNHALGLVSVDAMLAFQELRTAITRSLAGGAVLAAALVVHAGLGIGRLATRSTLRMPVWEAVQILLGLAIPILLLPHLVHTRFAHELLGVNDSYLYQLARLWPGRGVEQSLLLVIVWVHGSVGVHFWLRLQPWYHAVQPFLLSIAVALPLLALAGFSVSGREVQRAIASGTYFTALKEQTNWPADAEGARLTAWADSSVDLFLVLLAALTALIAGRVLAQRYWKGIRVNYAFGPTLRAPVGPTLLEISRMFGVPHASVCGGRARCSTCRVQVESGLDHLDPPQGAEAETLRNIGAAPDVRLACQIRPRHALGVLRLVRPQTGRGVGRPGDGGSQGTERTAVVLFLDLRGFTTLSEDRLPYDVVYLLNSFFNEAGRAIVAAGGQIDKYLGDGLMAVFDDPQAPRAAALRALRAAHDIDLAMDTVNERLAGEVAGGLRLGMGLHAGPLVMGRIGHGATPPLTVIGRTVNTASRLEQQSKDLEAQLILSTTVAALAGLPDDAFETRSVEVRGLSMPITVMRVIRARQLGPFLQPLPE